MLTFKATSHADWLTGWLADKAGGERTAEEEVWMIERRRGEHAVHKENWEILLTSPLPPSFPPSPPSWCLWMSSPISPGGSQISLVLRKAEPSPPLSVCLFTHLPPQPTPTSMLSVSLSTPFLSVSVGVDYNKIWYLGCPLNNSP